MTEVKTGKMAGETAEEKAGKGTGLHSACEKGAGKLRVVNRPVSKVDAHALVTGKAVYTNDLAPSDCLIVKVLRSPHAHALIKEINTARAEAVPGIECILTYKDCPDKRFTMAGQTYPEPSPYDRLILDQRVRFVGDAAAIIAGPLVKCPFILIHFQIHHMEKQIHAHCIVELRRTHGQRNPAGCCSGCVIRFQFLVYLLPESQPIRFPGVFQQDHKLIPAIPDNCAFFAHGGLQNLSYSLQHLISNLMTIRVIDVLEVIDIQHDSQDMAPLLHFSRQIVHVMQQIAAVIQVGQRVKKNPFILQVNVQRRQAKSRRDPDQRQSIVAKLDDAAKKNGS